jgi:diguanylate cyclase (GGDEF)-like protein
MTADVSHQTQIVAAVLATFAAGALASSIYATLERRRRERRARLRGARASDALTLLGEALASTHNPRALLTVILDATLAGTGAPGGEVRMGKERLAAAGETDGRQTNARGVDTATSRAHAPPLVFSLSEEDDQEPIELLLYPPAGGLPPELEQLAASIARQGRVALENARLHRVVEEQALTDDLTGLANRRRFLQSLAVEVSRTERFGGDLSVIIADLDDFKQVNDRFGHEAGDSVLREVATILRESLRDVDLPARLGGEEFGVIVPETDGHGAHAVAERVRAALKARTIRTVPGADLTVTASFGIASFPDAPTADGLMRAADAALYRAKAEGKDQTVASSD